MFKFLRRLSQRALSHNGIRRYFANTAWMLGEQALRLIAGLLVGIWIARYLGPERFGIFSYALSFVAIFSAIAKLGLDGIVVRELVREPQNRDIYLGTVFWLKLGGALATLALIATLLALLSVEPVTRLFVLIVASGMIFQSCEVVDFYFQSRVLSKYVSLSKLAQLALSSAVKIYLVLVKAELVWFVLVTLLDQATLAVSLLVAYRKQTLAKFHNHFDVEVAQRLLKDSWPQVLSGLTVMIYLRIDQILVKEFMGNAALGKYAAAVKISEVWYFIPMIITNSLFPAIIKAKSVSEYLYLLRLRRLYSFTAWMAIAVAIPLTFLADELVVVLYGGEFRAAGPVIKVHIWTGVFVSLGVASASWLISENLQTFALYRTASGAIVSVLLGLLLIPRFGLIGAAVSTLVAIAVASYFFDLFTRRTRPMFYQKSRALFRPISWKEP